MYFFKLIIALLCTVAFAKTADNKTINGSKIICDREAYNCPSYKGKKVWKRLKNCRDVKMVWKVCKNDVHGLDRDNDGTPCEKDCP